MTGEKTDARGLPVPEEEPDGALSGLFYKYDRQLRAARSHQTFEGATTSPRAVLEGYDRALHPWIRGWRPGEIGDTVRRKLRSVRGR